MYLAYFTSLPASWPTSPMNTLFSHSAHDCLIGELEVIDQLVGRTVKIFFDVAIGLLCRIK